jgi:hypothetical protein
MIEEVRSMAEIVLGMATSHGPMLSTPWEQWGQRVGADRQNDAHPFRGSTYDFEGLVSIRKDEQLAREITPESWRARFDACQAALETLREVYEAAAPDVAVIVGNDQRELFVEDNIPAFAVYWGEEIPTGPRTPEQIAKLPPGIAISERGHAPPEEMIHPGHPELGLHLIESLMDADFDISQSRELPPGSGYCNGIPHAFGFIYRRIMKDAVIPNVPVFLNTFYPPNQPTSARCHKLGRALGKAIADWDSDARVAVFASGGLSHFVIDEELDRAVLDALQTGDADKLISIPENLYQSGSSEIKNWIPLSAIMGDLDLDMTLVDYVPCYRSEAGTGNAMGFAYWQ